MAVTTYFKKEILEEIAQYQLCAQTASLIGRTEDSKKARLNYVRAHIFPVLEQELSTLQAVRTLHRVVRAMPPGMLKENLNRVLEAWPASRCERMDVLEVALSHETVEAFELTIMSKRYTSRERDQSWRLQNLQEGHCVGRTPVDTPMPAKFSFPLDTLHLKHALQQLANDQQVLSELEGPDRFASEQAALKIEEENVRKLFRLSV